jgi:hypothetical protein
MAANVSVPRRRQSRPPRGAERHGAAVWVFLFDKLIAVGPPPKRFGHLQHSDEIVKTSSCGRELSWLRIVWTCDLSQALGHRKPVLDATEIAGGHVQQDEGAVRRREVTRIASG